MELGKMGLSWRVSHAHFLACYCEVVDLMWFDTRLSSPHICIASELRGSEDAERLEKIKKCNFVVAVDPQQQKLFFSSVFFSGRGGGAGQGALFAGVYSTSA